jgi:ubiquinone/menaquinone biosynthesis C-methylase UbiE
MKDVSHILSQVADLFGQQARENTLNKCFGKHLGEIELILNSCRGKEKILDVGGGSGINLLCLKRINNELELNLIDNFDEYTEENPSGPAAHILQLLENSGIIVEKQDFSNFKLPYKSEYFDIVTGWDVIEHFPEPPFKLLKEMKRILKKDGTLLVSVPNLVSTARRGRFLLGRHPYNHFEMWIGEKYYGHYRECTRKEWQIIIEKAGFSQVKTFMVNEPTKTKAYHSYHDKKYSRFSWQALGLWALYFLDTIFPNLRTNIHCTAKKSS